MLQCIIFNSIQREFMKKLFAGFCLSIAALETPALADVHIDKITEFQNYGSEFHYSGFSGNDQSINAFGNRIVFQGNTPVDGRDLTFDLDLSTKTFKTLTAV